MVHRRPVVGRGGPNTTAHAKRTSSSARRSPRGPSRARRSTILSTTSREAAAESVLSASGSPNLSSRGAVLPATRAWVHDEGSNRLDLLWLRRSHSRSLASLGITECGGGQWPLFYR